MNSIISTCGAYGLKRIVDHLINRAEELLPCEKEIVCEPL